MNGPQQLRAVLPPLCMTLRRPCIATGIIIEIVPRLGKEHHFPHIPSPSWETPCNSFLPARLIRASTVPQSCSFPAPPTGLHSKLALHQSSRLLLAAWIRQCSNKI
ncbi:hypothetical protein M758_3G259300 [Ceratodon purpureus]|nr:hypothetical protein M758_3G259300 [Ceratodon purpureus]